MSSSIEPLNEIVVIRPDSKPSETLGGIVLTASVQEEPDRGTVVAVGPGRYLESGDFIPTTLKPGDRVLYAKGSGGFIKLDDDIDKLVVMPESIIIGKLTQ